MLAISLNQFQRLMAVAVIIELASILVRQPISVAGHPAPIKDPWALEKMTVPEQVINHIGYKKVGTIRGGDHFGAHDDNPQRLFKRESFLKMATNEDLVSSFVEQSTMNEINALEITKERNKLAASTTTIVLNPETTTLPQNTDTNDFDLKPLQETSTVFIHMADEITTETPFIIKTLGNNLVKAKALVDITTMQPLLVTTDQTNGASTVPKATNSTESSPNLKIKTFQGEIMTKEDLRNVIGKSK